MIFFVRLPVFVCVLVCIAFAPASADDSVVAKSVKLKWDSLVGARSYRIQISETKDFKKPLADERILSTEYQWVISGPGELYWRVAGIDDDGKRGPWSTPGKIDASLATPVIDAAPPINAVLTTKQPTTLPTQTMAPPEPKKPPPAPTPEPKRKALPVKKPKPVAKVTPKPPPPPPAPSPQPTVQPVKAVAPTKAMAEVKKPRAMKHAFHFLFGLGGGLLNITQDVTATNPLVKRGTGSGYSFISFLASVQYGPPNSWWAVKAGAAWTKAKMDFNSESNGSGSSDLLLVSWQLTGLAHWDLMRNWTLFSSFGFKQKPQYGIVLRDSGTDFVASLVEKIHLTESVGVEWTWAAKKLLVVGEIEASERIDSFGVWAVGPRFETRVLMSDVYWVGLRYEFDLTMLKSSLDSASGSAGETSLRNVAHKILVVGGVSLW